MMFITNPLKLMQKMLDENYKQYISGEITQKEYITRIKPIDKEIDKFEMSTLQDTPALKESFLLHSHKQEN